MVMMKAENKRNKNLKEVTHDCYDFRFHHSKRTNGYEGNEFDSVQLKLINRDHKWNVRNPFRKMPVIYTMPSFGIESKKEKCLNKFDFCNLNLSLNLFHSYVKIASMFDWTEKIMRITTTIVQIMRKSSIWKRHIISYIHRKLSHVPYAFHRLKMFAYARHLLLTSPDYDNVKGNATHLYINMKMLWIHIAIYCHYYLDIF